VTLEILPATATVVEAPSMTVFKRLLDTVDFSSFLMTYIAAAVGGLVKVFFLVLRACDFKPPMSCEGTFFHQI